MRADMRVLLAVCGLGVALAGCSSSSDILSAGKDAPDEFAIVTKQPLVIPPDFNLHPPRPGAAPTNQLSPTQNAQAALFSDDPNQIASTIHGNYSQGEKILLAKAGAANANDSIRQLIAADDKNLEAADTDFTNSLLFGGGSDDADAGRPLDANKEEARLSSMGVGNRPVADAAPAPQQTIAPAGDYAAPQSAYEAPPADASQPAVGGGERPPETAQSQPAPASAQTASTYAPPQAPEAGTLPPIGSEPQQTYQNPRPARKAHKDDSGWFDGIF